MLDSGSDPEIADCGIQIAELRDSGSDPEIAELRSIRKVG